MCTFCLYPSRWKPESATATVTICYVVFHFAIDRRRATKAETTAVGSAAKSHHNV